MENPSLTSSQFTIRPPLWRRILSVDQYSSSIDRSRANLIYALTLFIAGVYTLYAVSIPQWTVNGEQLTLWTASVQTNFSNPTSLLFLALYFTSFCTLLATRFGALEIGAWGVAAIWYISGVLLNIYVQEGLEEIGLAFGQFLVIASLSKRERGLYISGILSVFTLIAAYFVRGQTDDPGDVALLTLNIVATGLVLWAFLRFFSTTLSTSVSEAIGERIQADKVIAQATHLLETRPPAGQFLYDVSNAIRAQFDAVTRVQIYLLEPELLHIYLAADTTHSEAIPQSLAQEKQADALTVAQVIRRGEAAFARQNIETSEWILPLRIGSEAFGVLALTGSGRWFANSNVQDALTGLAADLSLAVDNVLQFDRAEQRQKENRELIEQANNAVRTVELLNQRLTRNLWTQYSAALEENIALDMDFLNTNVSQNLEWTDTLRHALSSQDVVQAIKEDAQVIAVPLQVRGEIIGAMEFEIDSSQNLTREDMEMLQEVAERFGLTAENTRLLIDSQRQAQREALVNQISLKLQSTSNVNAALTEAARGIRNALKADRVSIRLGKPNTEFQGDHHGA
jgi:hypothetical protein